MTPLRLTTWFKKRMLPLVVAAAIPIAVAAPLAFTLQKRSELLQTARGEAARLALVIGAEIDERPRLWRYDATKIGERLVAEGLDRRPLRVFEGGREGKGDLLRAAALPRCVLWGRQDVLPRGAVSPAASVWVAVDAGPLVSGAALLAALFTLLAASLGSVLYLLPVSAVRGAERRTHLLLGRLALTLQEEDRRRIARDLHDGAGQALTAARLELAALSARAAGAGDEQGREALRRITRQLDDALEEVRRSSTALGPPALEELGFARALERRCEALEEAAQIPVACSVLPLPILPAAVELAGYRIVQEALTNVARHARAKRAWVRVSADAERLTLEVGDDGLGLPAASASGEDTRRAGSGLEGIRERVRLLNGELFLQRPAGGGLVLRAVVPLLTEGPEGSDEGSADGSGDADGRAASRETRR